MNEQVCEQLTLFQEDSPVSRSPLPGSTKARTMTVTSGLRCLELYGNYAHLGSLVRMCLESSIWHSTRCLLTWKAWGTKRSRLLFQLVALMPHTNDTESVSWPTLPANGYGSNGHRLHLQKMVDNGIITEEERRQMIQGNGGKINPEWAEWLMGYEQQFTKLIPTPVASDANQSARTRYWMPKTQTVHVERERRVQASALRTGGSHSPWENWPAEPGVGRVADGVPNRVDRIRCLGNAVVPQQFYIFFKLIAEIERR